MSPIRPMTLPLPTPSRPSIHPFMFPLCSSRPFLSFAVLLIRSFTGRLPPALRPITTTNHESNHESRIEIEIEIECAVSSRWPVANQPTNQVKPVSVWVHTTPTPTPTPTRTDGQSEVGQSVESVGRGVKSKSRTIRCTQTRPSHSERKRTSKSKNVKKINKNAIAFVFVFVFVFGSRTANYRKHHDKLASPVTSDQ